ncbi:TetR/AcrR family transcriptional regulator [Rhodococcus wratislaviensis]|nr:TetR/AcrR family transcriptional regulator [Rhodococcus wratislaviensis]
METAERLFATRGVEGVTLREIQVESGQSNTSVITYHFGSKAGLVRALIKFRSETLTRRRDALPAPRSADARALVWLVVLPLMGSIQDGEMFVPFLARLSEHPSAHAAYWPDDVKDWSVAAEERIGTNVLSGLPSRLKRGRLAQLYNSVLNLLGELARSNRRISELQLHNYVDAWVGMLTAPVSEETAALLDR